MVDKSILLNPMMPPHGTEDEGDESDLKRANMLYEEKWDGTNSLAGKVNNEIGIPNRDGIDYGARGNLPEVNAELEQLPNNTVIHPEICGFNSQGFTELRLSSSRCSIKRRIELTDPLVRQSPVVLMAHDILMLKGESLEDKRLIVRKEILRRLLAQYNFQHIRFTEYVLHDGTNVYFHAKEGVMAKLIDSTYIHGRSHSWMKIKKRITEICDISGFYEGEGKRAGLIGGLVLSQNGEYVGKAGGFKDFKEADLRRIGNLMRALPVAATPFRIDRMYTPVNTTIKVKVRALCWTSDHVLREPVVIELVENAVAKRNVEKEQSLIFDGELAL